MTYRTRGRLAAIGFLGGMVAGAVIWGAQVQRSRRDLFGKSPVRRLAALGYLGGQPSPETSRLLTEYVRWEKHQLLRKRGQLVLRRVQAYLV